ncbi:MAG: c-type cytochrome [Verrucomicrobia subdivision 3 bacterium]|nr:c-type cytochrome [Limisphaerales bacterium]
MKGTAGSISILIAWLAGAAEPAGLIVTFRSGNAVDTTTLPNVALHVEAGKSPTPFVPDGPFTATWEGYLNADLRSEYAFAAELSGALKLEINGAVVLDGAAPSIPLSKLVQLNKGPNKLKAAFKSPERGDAFVRLTWTEKGTNTAPIPLSLLTHPSSGELEKGAQLRRGRELFLEYRCGRCHTPSRPAAEGGVRDAIPELSMDAPSFDGIGARRKKDWLVRWILDPKAERPSAHMPQVFRGASAKENAEAAGAYLATLTAGGDVKLNPLSLTPSTAATLQPSDEPLFERLHCTACHTAGETDASAQSPPTNKISLTHIAAKFPPGKLEEFLRQPEAYYAWTRMPNFRLTQAEARELSEFLMKGTERQSDTTATTAPAIIEKGKMLVQNSGCLNCHAAPLTLSRPAGEGTVKPSNPSTLQPSVAWPDNWTRGCMAEVPPERSPQYRLTPTERADLRAFGARGLDSLFRHAPVEFAERQTRLLNCAGCHGQFEGFPPMDILGGKLKPEWAGKFIAGEIPYKPRAETHPRGEPWLAARMPGFKARAQWLAAGMAALHGYPPRTPPEPPVNDQLAQLGRKLVGKDGGFSCVACHGVGALAAADVFDSEGINFVHAYERLLPDYYRHWMRNPLAIDPQTKMPVYFEDGRSPLTEILDGDAEQQITAIWHDLRLGSKMPPPDTGETPP